MNDWFLPVHALIRRVLGTGHLDPLGVEIVIIGGLGKMPASAQALLALLTSRPLLPVDDLAADLGATDPSAPVLLSRVALGGSGWTVHMNGGYNWHPGRWQRHPTRSSLDVSRNVLAFADLALRSHHLAPLLSAPEPSWWVVFANRPAHRRVVNGEDLHAALVKRYGKAGTYGRVVDFDQPLADTVAVLSSARALLSPHGAGLANLLFLRPGAVLLELLPFMCHRLSAFYAAMARSSLVTYHVWQPPTAALVQGLSEAQGEQAFNRRAQDEEPCRIGATRMSFSVDVEDVLAVLRDALTDQDILARAAQRVATRRLATGEAVGW